MKLSDALLKMLVKIYPPSTMVDLRYKGNDVTIKTDAEGNAILLFIGQRNSLGNVVGERYARTLKKDRDGSIIKDHWELKGKAS